MQRSAWCALYAQPSQYRCIFMGARSLSLARSLSRARVRALLSHRQTHMNTYNKYVPVIASPSILHRMSPTKTCPLLKAEPVNQMFCLRIIASCVHCWGTTGSGDFSLKGQGCKFFCLQRVQIRNFILCLSWALHGIFQNFLPLGGSPSTTNTPSALLVIW